MNAHSWDPERYLAFADERARPFVDLIARVLAPEPRRVVDLGCGPGTLTRLLAERWPDADVCGIDSSPEMIARAREHSGRRVRFEIGDLRDWRAPQPVDVLVSNATLQWIPGHEHLLPGLLAQVAPGGWLAFEVPGNFDEPSHAVRRQLAAEPPYADYTGGVAASTAFGPEFYLSRLLDLGCEVDAWETTYLHVLNGEDPVFAWVSGTSARPTLQALPDDLRPEYERELRRRLAVAYPPGPHGVVLPFRRVFAVARR